MNAATVEESWRDAQLTGPSDWWRRLCFDCTRSMPRSEGNTIRDKRHRCPICEHLVCHECFEVLHAHPLADCNGWRWETETEREDVMRVKRWEEEQNARI